MNTVVGERKKAFEFLNAAENFKKLQESIAKGRKIDILKVDPALTPCDILGYNEEERQKSKYCSC